MYNSAAKQVDIRWSTVQILPLLLVFPALHACLLLRFIYTSNGVWRLWGAMHFQEKNCILSKSHRQQHQPIWTIFSFVYALASTKTLTRAANRQQLRQSTIADVKSSIIF
jgi:hypothetical protein